MKKKQKKKSLFRFFFFFRKRKKKKKARNHSLHCLYNWDDLLDPFHWKIASNELLNWHFLTYEPLSCEQQNNVPFGDRLPGGMGGKGRERGLHLGKVGVDGGVDGRTGRLAVQRLLGIPVEQGFDQGRGEPRALGRGDLDGLLSLAGPPNNSTTTTTTAPRRQLVEGGGAPLRVRRRVRSGRRGERGHLHHGLDLRGSRQGGPGPDLRGPGHRSRRKEATDERARGGRGTNRRSSHRSPSQRTLPNQPPNQRPRRLWGLHFFFFLKNQK
jgi:hypothetical protein